MEPNNSSNPNSSANPAEDVQKCDALENPPRLQGKSSDGSNTTEQQLPPTLSNDQVTANSDSRTTSLYGRGSGRGRKMLQ